MIDVGIPLAFRNWTLKAACRDGEHADAFFPVEHERGELRQRRENAAKAICRRCPAVTECLQYALATETSSTRHGVWGSLSADERAERAKAVA